MNKKSEQIDLFPEEPVIVALGITDSKLKDGEIICTAKGATNINDLSLITNETWKKAIAGWFISLCDNDPAEAKQAIVAYWSELQGMIHGNEQPEHRVN